MTTPEQQRALLTVAVLAAFADGSKSEAERAEVKRIADTLGAQATELNLPQLLQDVLLKRVSVADAVAALPSPELRQLAYELAVCVCDADGQQSDAERRFLAQLKTQLGGTLDTTVETHADALARETDGVTAAAAPASVDRAALDQTIFQRAVLCGALELLPQSWASLAIIPLQVKLVHGIAQAHGFAMDAGMVKEFIATAGVGLTGQYLEQFGRKLAGGLLGSLLGGLGRGVGSAGAGIAMSFATTYALGQLAVRYYGGGRQMSTALLQQTYQDLLGSARQMQTQALPQIQQQARTLDATKVMDLVRRPFV